MMNEFEMVKNMLSRIPHENEDYEINIDEQNRKIYIMAGDEWYSRVFCFDENGKLIAIE